MADQDNKQFDPTAQRIQKARQEGNVYRSQEIVSVGTLITGVFVLSIGTAAGFGALKDLFREIFVGAASASLTPGNVVVIIVDLGMRVTLIIAPFVGAIMVTGVALNLLQTGINVTAKPLTPKLDRLNPMKGFQRIFSARGAFDTFKALFKIAVVAPLVYSTIKTRMPEIMMLFALPLDDAMTTAGGWIVTLMLQILFALLALAGIDYGYGRWKYKKDLKMSHEEIKDESKEQEGNPQIKSRQRQRALEISRRPRLLEAVLKADVVITNPTHYAIALKYDPVVGGAPRVLIKGIRKRALRIKALALEHHIPTVEDRPLARTLYKMVPEDREIPEELYPAVAAILAEIYRRRNEAEGYGNRRQAA